MLNIQIKELLIFLLVLVFLLAVLYFTPKHGVKVYDCSISEISPDYPLEVKEGCRKLRADKIK